MPSEPLIVDGWLDGLLRNDATLKAAAPGGVWADVAPEGSATPIPSPWVVWFQTVGVDARAVGSGPRIVTDLVFEVRATGRETTYGALKPAADRIDALIENARGAAVPGLGTVIDCHRVEPVRFTENDGGVLYRHLGGQYAIKVQAAA